MTPRPRHLAAAVVLLSIAAGTAGAQEAKLRAEAERRNRRASELYAAGRYEEALQTYQAAYDLYPEPKYLFNIGLAREKTFDYEGCALAFQQFLGVAPEAGEDVRRQAEERRAACVQRAQIPVRITSAPTNAAIYVGEGEARTLLGRTPLELKLGPGEYTVGMELAGYVPRTEQIAVEIGKRPQIDFVLEKLSSLRIEVDPAGARVKIDDFEWESAPTTREIAAGTHRVQVVKDGYQPASREVKVEAGQEVSLVMALQPLPQIRKLALRTRKPVAGVEVRLDGRPVAAPPVALEVSPGSHRLEVRAPGRLPFARDITVPPDRDLRLALHLEPVRSRRDQLVVWSLAGAAGGAALVGGIFGVLSLQDDEAFAKDPSPALQERGEGRAEMADAWFVTAAVLGGGAALYWFITTPRDSRAGVEY